MDEGVYFFCTDPANTLDLLQVVDRCSENISRSLETFQQISAARIADAGQTLQDIQLATLFVFAQTGRPSQENSFAVCGLCGCIEHEGNAFVTVAGTQYGNPESKG